jgi:hypothetical protein
VQFIPAGASVRKIRVRNTSLPERSKNEELTGDKREIRSRSRAEPANTGNIGGDGHRLEIGTGGVCGDFAGIRASTVLVDSIVGQLKEA